VCLTDQSKNHDVLRPFPCPSMSMSRSTCKKRESGKSKRSDDSDFSLGMFECECVCVCGLRDCNNSKSNKCNCNCCCYASVMQLWALLTRSCLSQSNTHLPSSLGLGEVVTSLRISGIGKYVNSTTIARLVRSPQYTVPSPPLTPQRHYFN